MWSKSSGVKWTISLAHATYHSQSSPLEVRDLWLASAMYPEIVDYCVGMDASDELALNGSIGLKRVVGPSFEKLSTSVRNWNAAAGLSTGSLIFAISDDLIPSPAWDFAIISNLGILNPEQTPFAAKVSDSPVAEDTLLRHPIVSRAFLTRHGLFSPEFFGVYCDNDLTLRAYKRAFILDLRSELQLEHAHPAVSLIEPSTSQSKQNSDLAYKTGLEVFSRRWPKIIRPMVVSLVSPRPARRPLRSFPGIREFITIVENLGYVFVRAPRFFLRLMRQR